jgi:hypothetical protein
MKPRLVALVAATVGLGLLVGAFLFVSAQLARPYDSMATLASSLGSRSPRSRRRRACPPTRARRFPRALSPFRSAPSVTCRSGLCQRGRGLGTRSAMTRPEPRWSSAAWRAPRAGPTARPSRPRTPPRTRLAPRVSASSCPQTRSPTAQTRPPPPSRRTRPDAGSRVTSATFAPVPPCQAGRAAVLVHPNEKREPDSARSGLALLRVVGSAVFDDESIGQREQDGFDPPLGSALARPQGEAPLG